MIPGFGTFGTRDPVAHLMSALAECLALVVALAQGLATPEQYWASTQPDELTISAIDDDVTDFREWLLARLTR
jgi:hypothetical protein